MLCSEACEFCLLPNLVLHQLLQLFSLAAET